MHDQKEKLLNIKYLLLNELIIFHSQTDKQTSSNSNTKLSIKRKDVSLLFFKGNFGIAQ